MNSNLVPVLVLGGLLVATILSILSKMILIIVLFAEYHKTVKPILSITMNAFYMIEFKMAAKECDVC